VTGPDLYELIVSWEDHRNSISDNELFDIYCNHLFPRNRSDLRISNQSSQSIRGDEWDADRPVTLEEYMDSGASRVVGDRHIDVIWTGSTGGNANIYYNRVSLP
jgi:hypothetical protein